MQDEADRLWRVERPIVVNRVSDAAAEGDRSENAEYIYGKKRLREIDARLGFLTRRLKELQVVDPSEERLSDRVFFGAWVRVEDEEGDVHVYRIVGPDETDAEQGHISMDSPMGRALLRKTVGDEVLVERPAGKMAFDLLEISYEPLPLSDPLSDDSLTA